MASKRFGIVLMGDTLTPEQRSERMSRVRDRGSKAEMVVRRLVHSLGYRYRLHVSRLPGRPDIVLPKHRKVILVHGCFWHRHDDCRLARLPKSRLDFWIPKLQRNRERDIENIQKLKDAGWSVLVVWECETSDMERLHETVKKFLESVHGLD